MKNAAPGVRLGKLFGFPIFADATILLLVSIFVLFGLRGGFGGLLDQLIFFGALIGSVIWHEIGHAIAVRKLKMGESMIILGGLGGRCVYRAQPSPRQGVIVALAGPGFGLVLGIASLVLYWTLPDPPYLVYLLAYINVLLNIGNLIPMYPLDGGQVLLYGLRGKLSTKRAETLTAYITFAVLAALAVALFLYAGFEWILVWVILAFVGIEAWRLYQRAQRTRSYYSHYDDAWK